MKFKHIKQLTRGRYTCDVMWSDLEEKLGNWTSRTPKLDLDPEFQRGHVWTEKQQRAYVEFCLQGGTGSNIIRFNCAGWQNDYRGPFVLVDGKQRLEAVRRFLRNEIDAFGYLYKEFEDRLPFDVGFVFQIADLKRYEDVLCWYLEINTGGVVHTEEELSKVVAMLSKEREKKQ